MYLLSELYSHLINGMINICDKNLAFKNFVLQIISSRVLMTKTEEEPIRRKTSKTY